MCPKVKKVVLLIIFPVLNLMTIVPFMAFCCGWRANLSLPSFNPFGLPSLYSRKVKKKGRNAAI
jgi:hypothetical protein